MRHTSTSSRRLEWIGLEVSRGEEEEKSDEAAAWNFSSATDDVLLIFLHVQRVMIVKSDSNWFHGADWARGVRRDFLQMSMLLSNSIIWKYSPPSPWELSYNRVSRKNCALHWTCTPWSTAPLVNWRTTPLSPLLYGASHSDPLACDRRRLT